MAAVLAAGKFSLRYTSTDGSESSTRTVSGLNIAAGGVPDSGINRDTAVGWFIETLASFSTGTNSNFRWITEQEVSV